MARRCVKRAHGLTHLRKVIQELSGVLLFRFITAATTLGFCVFRIGFTLRALLLSFIFRYGIIPKGT